MSLLRVRGLRAGYAGIPVVFGVDLEVGRGEIVAVLGANGAGKTTTLRAISGIVRPLGGEVVFDDRRIAGRPADMIARSGMVHVPEGRGLFRSLTVEESLSLAAAAARASRADIPGLVAEMYEIFPRLKERKGQPAGTLSGGEQQMLALARGMVARPRLLLIDEMSQGLAPTVVAGLFELVARFPERGTSVLLVEQFVSRALALASRAYVLEKGVVTYAGDAKKLAQDSDFVRSSYLGGGEVEAEDASGRSVTGVRQRVTARPVAAEQVTVPLPPALMRTLTEQAEREGVPVGDLVARALRGLGDGAAGETAAALGEER